MGIGDGNEAGIVIGLRRGDEYRQRNGGTQKQETDETLS